MRRAPRAFRRHAATLAETVIVHSVVLMLTLGVIVVGIGVYYYQQVSALAREGARWASVHGGQYSQETGNPMATQQLVSSNAIQPMAVGLDKSQFTSTNPAVSWDNANEMPTYRDANSNVLTNHVTVTVTYKWYPVLYVAGPVTLSSTSVMPMQY